MSLTRSAQGTSVDWMEVAAELAGPLREALEELSIDSHGICVSENNDINTLLKRNSLAIEQLKTMLERFTVPDLVNIAAETQITNIVIADELLEELKELGLPKENLRSKVGILKDLIANLSKRNENLVEIIQGLKIETEANEGKSDAEELQKLMGMKSKIKEVLNTILDEGYPEMKRDIKTVLQALYEAKDQEDSYIQVPETVDLQVIMLLLTAKIIEQHETDATLIRLMI